jgi:hypothetical protein
MPLRLLLLHIPVNYFGSLKVMMLSKLFYLEFTVPCALLLLFAQQGFLGIVKQIEMAPSSLSLEEITLCAGRKVMTLATIFC